MNRREHKRKPTKFNQDITILRGGKELRNYDLIQNGRDSAEIFDMTEEERQEAGLVINKAYGDQTIIDELSSLRGSFDKHEQAMKKWNELPIEIRRKFNNDPKEFAENGAEWLKNEVKKIDEENKRKMKEMQEKNNNNKEKGE